MKKRFFYAVPILYCLLGISGLLTIVSSQYGGDAPFHLPLRQFLFLIAGGAVLTTGAWIPFEWYRRNAFCFGVLSVGALVLLPLFGVSVNGMCGWFRLGGFMFQPSELTKAFFLLALLAVKPGKFHFLFSCAVAAAWSVPILLQPDFGTAAIYLALFFAVLFLSGADWKQLGVLLGAGGIAGAVFLRLHPYAQQRIFSVLYPDADPLGASWHVRQLILAIERGGFFGNRLDGALWSYAYVPLPYNDSAFATLTESLGFCGAFLVIVLFCVLIQSLLKLAAQNGITANRQLFIQGSAALIALQSLVHISVNLALLPPTGLTLPLISYGGSSMIGCALLLGMALSAARMPHSPASAELPLPDADGGTMSVDGAPAAMSR